MTDQRDMLPDATPEELAGLIGKDLGELPESKWAPLLANLVSVLEALYRRQGRGEEEAFRQARDSAMAIADYFGGRVVYLPRGDRMKIALRDAEIYRRAKAGNIDELATEFGLTSIHVYRIVRQQRALYLRKMQGRLFTD